MAQSAAASVYRPGQGVYARSAAGAAELLVALFACLRLYGMILVRTDEVAFTVLGMDVQYATLWAGGAFVVLGALVFLFTFGVSTGLRSVDSRTHGVIDRLIDTETELAKVSWPSREDVSRSTTAVLICILLVGGFIFGVDLLVGFIMRLLEVLPG